MLNSYTYEAVTVSGDARNVRLDKISCPDGSAVCYDDCGGGPHYACLLGMRQHGRQVVADQRA